MFLQCLLITYIVHILTLQAEELEMEKFITHAASFSEISKSFEYMLKGESLRTIICMDG